VSRNGHRREKSPSAEGRVPDLIEYGSVRGDFHLDTIWSDGAHSIREMEEEGMYRGLGDIIMCNHSGGSLSPRAFFDEIQEQDKKIEKANDELNEITIFHGIEVNIEKTGKLMLKKLFSGSSTLGWESFIRPFRRRKR
jgi:DNA polymerase (family 10)